MTDLFARYGVDYRQWRAVSGALLRSDFRSPVMQGAGGYSLRAAGGWLNMILVFGSFGLVASVIVAVNPNVRLTGTVTLTYLMFLLATSVLSQHGASILATVDHAVLGPRPVSSRTYFAIRITNVLFHGLFLTTLMAYPPIAAFTLAHGVDVWRGGAAAAAIYAAALTVTLTLTGVYGVLLQRAGAARLKRVVAYAQMATGLLVYGGFFVLLQWFGRATITTASLPDNAWLYLVPPAWFASYLEIATGEAGTGAWIRAALSVAALGAAMAALQGKMSGEYAERLAQVAVSSETGRAPDRWLGRGEHRAVATLVLAHFRHDMRVRMGILAILPMLLLYVLLDLQTGGTRDPFTGGAAGDLDFLALVVLVFPALLMQQFGASDAWRASWIFEATPADRGGLLAAQARVSTRFFLVPFVLFMAAVFTWRFGHAGHAFVHATLLGLVGHAVLLGAMWVRPVPPFSLPPDKTLGSASLLAWMLVVLLGGQLLLVFLESWVYGSWPRVAGFTAVVLLLSWALERGLAFRAVSAARRATGSRRSRRRS